MVRAVEESDMATMTRWLAPAVLAAGLGMAALFPAPARAQSDAELARVLVDVADVIFRAGTPYYRYGNYGYDDRLIVVRDRYGRPVYYRQVPRTGYRSDYRGGPPYGKAHGYWKKHHRPATASRVTCDRYGRCVTRYYDPRYDRRHYGSYYDNRHYDNRRYDYGYDRYGHDRYGYDRYGYDRRDRYWDGYRWRYRDYDH